MGKIYETDCKVRRLILHTAAAYCMTIDDFCRKELKIPDFNVGCIHTFMIDKKVDTLPCFILRKIAWYFDIHIDDLLYICEDEVYLTDNLLFYVITNPNEYNNEISKAAYAGVRSGRRKETLVAIILSVCDSAGAKASIKSLLGIKNSIGRKRLSEIEPSILVDVDNVLDLKYSY